MIVQTSLDLREFTEAEKLEADLQARWRRNEIAHADYWNVEMRACYWAFDREDWPASLFEYERRAVVAHYETAQCIAESLNAPLRSYNTMLSGFEEDYQHKKKMAEGMAVELRQAFIDRKPNPFRISEGWEWLLVWAVQIASIPIECLVQEEEVLA